MKSKLFVLLLLGGIVPVCALRSETADSLRNGKTYPIGEVVVTGTRHETDVRHLPMTISVVGRQKIAEGFQPSLLPTLTRFRDCSLRDAASWGTAFRAGLPGR